MRTAPAWFAVLVCAFALSGCEQNGSGSGQGNDEFRITVPGVESLPTNPEDVVATVNGRPLTGAMLELYAASRRQQHPTGKPPRPRELSEELVNLELLADEAQRTGVAGRPAIAAELYFQRANLLASAMMEELARNADLGDAQVERRYAQRYPDGKITEYRTRQILVNDRATAESLIAKLRSGSSFAELAKSHSKGPAAAQGGALEWFQPNAVLPEFADAVAGLNTGEFSKTPVRTTYGWHVILLEEQRQVEAPPIDRVAPEIVQELMTERLESHLEELRANAEVEIKQP